MTHASPADLLGYGGAVMTLIAFAQTDAYRMRIAAIFANAFFILFALAAITLPVLLLHALLLPLNIYRLGGLRRRMPTRRTQIPPSSSLSNP